MLAAQCVLGSTSSRDLLCLLGCRPEDDICCSDCDAVDGLIDTSLFYRDLYSSDVCDFVEFARHSGGFGLWGGHWKLPEGLRVGNYGFLQDRKG